MSRGEVFIVDDNPNNLNLLAGMLRDAGYTVRIANSGRRALDALARHRTELVLLDINMPDMDGYAVCEALRADERTRSLPVIFLSALDDVRDKLAAFRAGGVDYVTKPFHAEEVLARVDSQIRLARLRAEVEAQNEELARRNRELVLAYENADHIFAALSDSLPGTTLADRYLIGDKIGAGGFAVVYRGTHVRTGQAVAIKILRPEPGADPRRQQARFQQEGLTAVRLTHPSAVTVFDSGTTPAGIAFLVMELLSGRTLADAMGEGPMSLARAAEIIVPVGEVLVEAHAAGIVHRDIKPANIVLHDGPPAIVKVVDFGIAKRDGAVESEHLTTAGRLLGTPAYMSPERLLGHASDAKADVYALAVTLFQMLTGSFPFDIGDRALGAVILSCVYDPPLPLCRLRPDLPRELEALLLEALAKEPGPRPTAERFRDRLVALAPERYASAQKGADAPALSGETRSGATRA